MAEETGDKAPTQEEFNKLRSELDTKVAEANQRADDASNRASQAEARVVGDEFKVDLPDSEESMTAEQRTSVAKALEKGAEASSFLKQMTPMLIESQAKALALEVALEHEAGSDVDSIRTRIKAGGTPAKMEALAKEISLEYKEKAIEAKAKGKGDDDDADDSGSDRKFAEGGGKGSVSPNKFIKDVDDIDIDDPDAQKNLDKLYETLTAKV